MRAPTLSVVLTINERPIEVIRKVLLALRFADFEQLVVALDGTPNQAEIQDELQEAIRHLGFHRNDGTLRTPFIDRDPGWLCPARAWNTAFAGIRSELSCVLSSETVLESGSLERCKELLAKSPAVLLGKCLESEPGKYGFSRPDGILCSSGCARPLGFIACFPTWALRATGGYDEEFMKGYWYDDDDFFYRLWRLNLPFIFDDSISGVHQSHPRPVLDTPEGQAGIQRNRVYILKKWGSEHPIHQEKIHVWKQLGRTIWFRKPELVTETMKETWTI